MKSLILKFSIECANCSQPLPVNRASESIQCVHCLEQTQTPVELWDALITPRLLEACNMEPGTDTWAKGMMAGIGSYRLTFGCQNPRCPECDASWDIGDIHSIHEKGHSLFTCRGCGKESSLRRPPEWFTGLMPHAKLLLGEVSDESQHRSFKGKNSVSIFCYHCSGPLPLDGSRRTVTCSHCGNECMVSDDIWLRLNPVTAPHPWYVVIDLADGVALLPHTIDDFIDLEGMPDDTTALLWEDDSGYCIGRVDDRGLFTWIVRDIFCSDYARLFFVSRSDLLWVLDHDEEVAHAFNAGTGEKILTIENEDHDPDLISVMDHYNAAVNTDGTIVVYRCWQKDNSPDTITEQIKRQGPHILTASEIEGLNRKSGLWEMRRFNEKGERIPLWQGLKAGDGNRDIPEWNSLPDQPTRPPDNAMIEPGPGGTLYMIDPEHVIITRYDSSGKCLGLIKPDAKVVEEVLDCGIAGDGTICIVFDHRKKIGRESWSHIARIGLDGSFQILTGPHAPVHDYPIGAWVKRISVTERGSIHICSYNFINLRVINPDGSLFWRSPGTIIEDKTLSRELAEARRKKS